MNGHVSSIRIIQYPTSRRKFCEKCGAPTITQCPKCNQNIRGDYISDQFPTFTSDFPVPSFCDNCGSPFPWTQRSIEAAKELAYELDMLDEQDKAHAIGK